MKITKKQLKDIIKEEVKKIKFSTILENRKKQINVLNEILSKIPIDFKKSNSENIDKEILRISIIAELDAISLYEQLSENTINPNIKKVLLDIAKEEKTHIGEFQSLLLELDKEQEEELEKGKKETEELTED